MAAYRLLTVDVFTRTPLAGNPVAVLVAADALDAATMQRIAAWTNLSETTFLLDPTEPAAAYRLRIFTPHGELPFAGHPSIGTAHAARVAGIVPVDVVEFRQECAAGVLPLRVDETGRIAVQSPPARLTPLDAGALDAALGAAAEAPRRIDVGAVWLVARLADERAVRGLRPDLAAVARLAAEHGASGVTVFADGDPVVVRSFAPGVGVPEDPVCGSGNAAVGAWRLAAGAVRTPSTCTASQGREVGRDGVVHVAVGADGTWVGGHTVTVVAGTLRV